MEIIVSVNSNKSKNNAPPSHILNQRPQVVHPLRASKWLDCRLLIDENEMASLLSALGEFWMYPLSGLIPIDKELITLEEFLDCYRNYVNALKNGQKPDEASLRRCFAAAWTVDPGYLYSVRVSDTQQLNKAEKPVIQVQHHTVDYSETDNKFRSMVLGTSCVSWGLQLSYPQIFQDSITMEMHQVLDSSEIHPFHNTELFRKLQQWVRHHTVATPFVVEGKRINAPIRLGKACFGWINNHPQLALKQLGISDYSHKGG